MGKPLPDLRTLQGAREYAADMQDVARKVFDERGSHPLVGHLLATRAPPQSFFESTGCARFDIPASGVGMLTILANRIGCDGDRNRFTFVMQLMARVVEAVGTITIFEGWCVPTSAPSMKEAIEHRRELPRDLGDYPGRKEGIVMILEHAKSKGSILWHAMITREGDRGILGEFIEGSKVQGRFTDHLGKQGAS